ncbi:hypothetical protein [Paenibacillus silvae]|uniref:Uncharacterized protein n=1 Tax=Paenibacillus silvae TaxID=1325358 RepID=A0A2W6NDQ5_9BACL|nr:hypothetical protein [Paenibacillus silvae]PZT54117.1 hypothetical protein DN757_18990 [Paenibacillus silvae]
MKENVEHSLIKLARVNDMARVHFAKFNFNEEIYKIYEKEERRDALLLELYKGINSEVKIIDPQGATYKFISLDKDPDSYVVNGRLVVFAPGVHVSYQDDLDDIEEIEDDKKAKYITFSFDVYREVVGYVAKADFGRIDFLKKFGALIEECCDVGEVEMVLQTDLNKLQDKLTVFSFVKEVSITAIPPNGDREHFAALMGSNAEEIKKTESTRFKMEFIGTAKKGINIASGYIMKWIGAITAGYGSMTVSGKNSSNEEVVIQSQKDAPFTRPIPEQSKDTIPTVAEKTRAGISQLEAMKIASEGLMESGERERDEK